MEVVGQNQALGNAVSDEEQKLLAKRVASFRRQAGLTQQQLCDKAKISYSTLTKIERGAIRTPSVFTVASIAAAVGQTLESLLGVSDSSPTKIHRKSTSGISFIYFDVNGVLVRFFQRGFSSLAQEAGISSDRIESIFWHYNDQVCDGSMSMDEFNHQLAKQLGIDRVDWQKHYISSIEAVSELHQTLKWVQQNYQTGLLTNIMPGFIEAMDNAAIINTRDFEVIIDSSQVGFTKPDSRIYDIATREANVKPDEILLIDDTRSNLIAAEKVGWKVLWFDNFAPAESAVKIRQLLE